LAWFPKLPLVTSASTSQTASKDALVKAGHSALFQTHKFIAKAAIPDAEEAIPELWGYVSIVK
jgi:hypothetical protein